VEEYAEEIEDDGLGYYEDGVKRTLTDEQIAIFRHSEIQALLRDRRHAEEAQEDEYESPAIEPTESVSAESPFHQNGSLEIDVKAMEEGEFEEGELEDDISTPQAPNPQSPQNQNNKRGKRKKNKIGSKNERPPQPKGFFRQNVKPDLRKRTWDKVDSGLANLDYDEDAGAATIPNPAAQRRRISYND